MGDKQQTNLRMMCGGKPHKASLKKRKASLDCKPSEPPCNNRFQHVQASFCYCRVDNLVKKSGEAVMSRGEPLVGLGPYTNQKGPLTGTGQLKNQTLMQGCHLLAELYKRALIGSC